MGVASQPGLARHLAFVSLLKSEFVNRCSEVGEIGEIGGIGAIGEIGRAVKHGAVKILTTGYTGYTGYTESARRGAFSILHFPLNPYLYPMSITSCYVKSKEFLRRGGY